MSRILLLRHTKYTGLGLSSSEARGSVDSLSLSALNLPRRSLGPNVRHRRTFYDLAARCTAILQLQHG